MVIGLRGPQLLARLGRVGGRLAREEGLQSCEDAGNEELAFGLGLGLLREGRSDTAGRNDARGAQGVRPGGVAAGRHRCLGCQILIGFDQFGKRTARDALPVADRLLRLSGGLLDDLGEVGFHD